MEDILRLEEKKEDSRTSETTNKDVSKVFTIIPTNLVGSSSGHGDFDSFISLLRPGNTAVLRRDQEPTPFHVNAPRLRGFNLNRNLDPRQETLPSEQHSPPPTSTICCTTPQTASSFFCVDASLLRGRSPLVAADAKLYDAALSCRWAGERPGRNSGGKGNSARNERQRQEGGRATLAAAVELRPNRVKPPTSVSTSARKKLVRGHRIPGFWRYHRATTHLRMFCAAPTASNSKLPPVTHPTVASAQNTRTASTQGERQKKRNAKARDGKSNTLDCDTLLLSDRVTPTDDSCSSQEKARRDPRGKTSFRTPRAPRQGGIFEGRLRDKAIKASAC